MHIDHRARLPRCLQGWIISPEGSDFLFSTCPQILITLRRDQMNRLNLDFNAQRWKDALILEWELQGQFLSEPPLFKHLHWLAVFLIFAMFCNNNWKEETPFLKLWLLAVDTPMLTVQNWTITRSVSIFHLHKVKAFIAWCWQLRWWRLLLLPWAKMLGDKV